VPIISSRKLTDPVEQDRGYRKKGVPGDWNGWGKIMEPQLRTTIKDPVQGNWDLVGRAGGEQGPERKKRIWGKKREIVKDQAKERRKLKKAQKKGKVV